MNSWYKSDRTTFLNTQSDIIYLALDKSSQKEGYVIENEQKEEWFKTIELMQEALREPKLSSINGVLIEYNFKRMGLRIDFVLTGPGVLFITEFKRTGITADSEDQVMRYAKNLLEFHELTQEIRPYVVPILVTRTGNVKNSPKIAFHNVWKKMLEQPMRCQGNNLSKTMVAALDHIGQEGQQVDFEKWDASPFHPSTQMIDATITLFGQHQVSAMKDHAAEAKDINICVENVKAQIREFNKLGEHGIIIVTGAPGAGKTLVGLNITFSKEFAKESVFVSGNAPLVEVLRQSLLRSYKRMSSKSWDQSMSGFTRDPDGFVEEGSVFKIVNAHNFLEHNVDEKNKRSIAEKEGNVIIFDEAQRTLSEGKIVGKGKNASKLKEHESYLILNEMRRRPGSVIVLLLGHNQNINSKEMGAGVWFNAAIKYGWKYAVSDESLELKELSKVCGSSSNALRVKINGTHLANSIRNQHSLKGDLEKWARLVLEDESEIEAKNVLDSAKAQGRTLPIYITRSLQAAKKYVRSVAVIQSDRVGIIAAGQGKRLRAEGIMPYIKPYIADWMLCPSKDIRSSNMLEEAQNQYQIQGLEIDYSIVCWDADLRRRHGKWACYNISGEDWNKGESQTESRLNSYRVLLTRSRIGMVIFVPTGCNEMLDPTRTSSFYDPIADHLIKCGAEVI